ncbi:MAG: O-antigen ligase family protein [Ahrensia sp.]|nr:O-antigen ligase family protein [Ahrensia sp.]
MRLDLPRRETLFAESGRNWLALILFVIWPLLQIALPRTLPLFFGIALLTLCSFALIARLRGEPDRFAQGYWSFNPRDPLLLLGLLYLTLMAVSLSWSPMPERGIKDIAVLFGALIIGRLFVLELARTRLLSATIFAVIALSIGALAMIAETWGISSFHDALLDTNFIYDLNRNAAWLVLLGCAALAALHAGRHMVIAVAVATMVLFAIFSGEGEAAKLGALLAIAAMVVATYAPTLIKPLVGLMALAVLMMPLLSASLAKTDGTLRIPIPEAANAQHRVALWQDYSQLALQRPVLGWGVKGDRMLGESGLASRRAGELGFGDETTSPHNIALEIWVNQGVVGIAIVINMLLVLAWRICELPNWPRASAFAMLTAAFAVSMTGSSFYQTWWIATIASSIVMWHCLARRREPRSTE